ncbi:Dynein heavy chain 17, axonemal, partial [Cladochytrium tenue]
MQLTKNNVAQIHKVMRAWYSNPIVERKDGKKLLNMEEKDAKIAAIYETVRRDGQAIHDLVKHTCEILEVDSNTSMWAAYLAYVDGIVKEGFFSAIRTSVEYLAENMNPDKVAAKEVGPLLEAKLELDNEMLVFNPGMDEESSESFLTIIEDLLDSIYDISSLMPRIAPAPEMPLPSPTTPGAMGDDGMLAEEEPSPAEEEARLKRIRQMEIENETYLGEMKKNARLNSLRTEILERVHQILEECQVYRETFDQYTYLWTENRQEYMKNFLAAGKKNDAGEETTEEDDQ